MVDQHELDRYARDLDANFITQEEILAQVAPLWTKLGFEDKDVRSFTVEPDRVIVRTVARYDLMGSPHAFDKINVATCNRYHNGKWCHGEVAEVSHTYRTASLERSVEMARTMMELDELAETTDSVTKVN